MIDHIMETLRGKKRTFDEVSPGPPVELSLSMEFHPKMKLPFEFNVAAPTNILKLMSDMLVVDLLEECEEWFASMCDQAGKPLALQISIIWNTRTSDSVVDPDDKLAQHFASGDTIGLYGDILPADDGQPPKTEAEKIPVTILTGFLGSGKTTLLNYILREQREKKICIIENEFGEISIDDQLLKQEKMELAENIVSMDNGCLCCTVRGDLVLGLNQILSEMRVGRAIDAIMIETTGMADPVPIVKTFRSEPGLAAELRLDAVITMADAKHLLGRLDEQVEAGKVNEAYQQIAFADKIILNKLDLVSTEQAIAVKDRIRSVNKFAKVVPAVRGRVRMDELSGIHAHDISNLAIVDFAKEADDSLEIPHDAATGSSHGGHYGHGGHGDHAGQDGHDSHGDVGSHGGHGGHGDNDGHGGGGGHDSHGHHGGDSSPPSDGQGQGHGHGHVRGHGHGKEESRHDSRVNSFALMKEGEIDPMKLHRWMMSIERLHPSKGIIYRIKAILAVKGDAEKYVFHSVMDSTDSDHAGPWLDTEKKVSKIVFIGKSLDKPLLTKTFFDIFEE